MWALQVHLILHFFYTASYSTGLSGFKKPDSSDSRNACFGFLPVYTCISWKTSLYLTQLVCLYVLITVLFKQFVCLTLNKRIVLYCIVLYCIVLYCIELYCIVLYCIVLYCIVLYCVVLYILNANSDITTLFTPFRLRMMSVSVIQWNFNGLNTFGTMEIC